MTAEAPIHHDEQNPIVPESVPVIPYEGIGKRAVDSILVRNMHNEALQRTNEKLAQLDELRPPGIINRFKQRRALKQWLDRHGYSSHYDAQGALMHSRAHITSEHETADRYAQVDIEAFRLDITSIDDRAKVTGDILLRSNGISSETLEACDRTAPEGKNERNIFDWLSLPEGDVGSDSQQATNSEVETVLLWNAERTEALLAESQHLPDMIHAYRDKLAKAAAQGRLAPNLAASVPAVKEVLVGDIFDKKFLGDSGVMQFGAYSPQLKQLTIWPYELPAQDEHAIEGVVEHEVTHSIGGFVTRWINEGFTERFVRIANNTEPGKISDTYSIERDALEVIMARAPNGPVTDVEVSEYYSASNELSREENEALFTEHMKRAYQGVDIIHHVNEAYVEGIHMASRQTTSINDIISQANRCLLASANMMTVISTNMATKPYMIDMIIDIYKSNLRTETDAISRVAMHSGLRFFEDAKRVRAERESQSVNKPVG